MVPQARSLVLALSWLLVGCVALTDIGECDESALQSDERSHVSLLQVGSQPHPARGRLIPSSASDMSKPISEFDSQAALVSTVVSTADAGPVTVWTTLLPVGIAALLVCLLCSMPRSESLAKSAPFAAEFAGTFVLVFTVSCCVLVGAAAWNALAVACSLMVMIYAVGPISGGNLNPAVSFALGLSGTLDWKTVLGYWFAQISAGFAAASFASAVISGREPVSLSPVLPFRPIHAMAVETLFTGMLCFVVLNCAVSKRNNSPTDGNQFYALAIGFVIVAGGYAVGGISGACFNPAVAMGLDIRHIGFGWGIIYTIFQLVGATFAALLYAVLRPEEALEGSDLLDYTPKMSVKCLAEFLGTFALSLTVLLNVVMGSVATPLSAAAALMCMVYALGDVSGAHFNPAVTAACVARGATSMRDGLAYVAVQVAAGIAAAMVAWPLHVAAPSGDKTFSLRPGDGFGFGAAGAAELLFTFVLAYVVLATATTQKPQSQVSKQNSYFGLCIGSCVTAGGFAVGAVSGGELNPAVSLAVYVMSRVSPGLEPAASVGYILGFATLQLAGGLIAAAVFRLTHPREFAPTVSTGVAALYCEFVGTFVLVLTAGFCSTVGSSMWGATAIAMALMVMVYATAPVSGGNLNPAVSFALGLSGDLPWTKVMEYCVAQIVGGACAVGVYTAILEPRHKDLTPVPPFSWEHAVLAEILYTCMLCFVVLNCAASKQNSPADDRNQFFGLAIGFVVIAGGYAAGGISGACLNPAVSLGIDISHLGLHWGMPWVAAELLGASLAALLYRAVRPGEREAAEALREPSMLCRCLSEFLGVFVLTLTVGLNAITSSMAGAWSAAAALMCMIYALGDVSGGHFNPAVTLAVVASGRSKCSPAVGAGYVASQVAAGALAAATCAIFGAAGQLPQLRLSPGAGEGVSTGGFVEFVFTCVLAYVVLAVATTKRPASQLSKRSFHFALAIGSCVTAGGFAIGSVSGGELNPAVAIGLAMSSPAASMISLLPFVLYELSGALLAVIAFRMTHPTEYAAVEKA